MSMFESFMNNALLEAKKAFSINEIPVGCVISHNGQIIAHAHNMVENHSDKTAHAEMIALNIARKHFGTHNFQGLNLSLYSTLEPCCMCMAAISMHQISKVYFSCEDQKFGGTRIWLNNSSYFKPEIVHIHNEESEMLLKRFFESRR
jgi:tRNA(adenine34) deaminase